MPRPPISDLVLAVVLFALGAASGVGSADSSGETVGVVALTALYALPLAFRRGAPFAIPLLSVAAVLASGVFDVGGSQPTIPLAVAIAAYTLGHDVPMPRSGYAVAALLGAFWTFMLAIDDVPPADLVFVALLYGAPWAFGSALRARGKQAAAGREEAVQEERQRIARELHDVVAHALSVVSVQTQAVRRRLDPEQAREAEDLRRIEGTVREAMGEMRRLLGVLRAEGELAPLAPQPGLGDLDSLIADARAAGLAVDAAVAPRADALPAGLEITAFRIVQEALTNVRRHAHASRVAIDVRPAGELLLIEVRDDGRGGTPNGSGHGLAGMRERAALYGGSLAAGPSPGGGFAVRAQLPLAPAAS
jgi:signal transduction histidine kinase